MLDNWTPISFHTGIIAQNVTQAFGRFHGEAERSHPARQHPIDNAWEILMIARFEAVVPPSVRLEMMRKGPPLSFTESRARDKKHAVHSNHHMISAVTSPPQPPRAPTHSTTTLMLQHEEFFGNWHFRYNRSITQEAPPHFHSGPITPQKEAHVILSLVGIRQARSRGIIEQHLR